MELYVVLLQVLFDLSLLAFEVLLELLRLDLNLLEVQNLVLVMHAPDVTVAADRRSAGLTVDVLSLLGVLVATRVLVDFYCGELKV